MKKLLLTLLISLFASLWLSLADSNFDVTVTANPNPAISGDNVNFTVWFQNHTTWDCKAELVYDLSNNINLITEPHIGLDPRIEWITGTINVASWDLPKEIIHTNIKQYTRWNNFGIILNWNYKCSNTGWIINEHIFLQKRQEVQINKTLTSSIPHQSNQDMTYKITLFNAGSLTASWYTFYEIYPEFFNINSNFTAHFSITNEDKQHTDTLSNNEYSREGDYLNINPGQTLTITIDWTISQNTNLWDNLTNTSRIDNFSRNNISNTTATHNFNLEATDLNIKVQYIGTQQPATIYDPIVFEVSYINNGNIDASGVYINGFMNNIFWDDDAAYHFISNERLANPQFWHTTTWAHILRDGGPANNTGLPGEVGVPHTFIITGYFNTGMDIPANNQVCLRASIVGNITEDRSRNSTNNDNYSNPACVQITGYVVPDPDISMSLDITTPLTISGQSYAISGDEVSLHIQVTNIATDDFLGHIECNFPTDLLDHSTVNTSPWPHYWTENQGYTTAIRSDGFTINNSTQDLYLTGIISAQTRSDEDIICNLKQWTITEWKIVDYTGTKIWRIPELIITKELISDQPSDTTDPINYQIHIKNIGSANADDYYLVDTLPTQLLNIPSPVTMSFYNTQNAHITVAAQEFSLADSYLRQNWSNLNMNLQPGEALEVNGTFYLDSELSHIGKTGCNQARIGGLSIEYDTANNESSCILTSIDAPNLVLEITPIWDSPEILHDPVVFQIDITNSGNIATSGLDMIGFITDQVFGDNGNTRNLISNQRRNISSNNNGRELNRGQFNEIQPKETLTIIVTGYLNSDTYIPGQTICLSATVGSNIQELLNNNYLDNTDSKCHTVSGDIIDLQITKTLLTDLTTVTQWDQIAYEVTFVNSGDSLITGITVTDNLPVTINYNSFSIVNNFIYSNATNTNNSLTFHDITLNPRQIGSFIISWTLNTSPNFGLDITNTGFITSNSREFNTWNNTFGLTNMIPSLADIVITKSIVGEMPAILNDPITYRITYANIWGRPADITIYDNLLFDGLTCDIYNTSPRPIERNSDGSGHRNKFILQPWQSWEILLVAHLNNRFESNTVLPNLARAESSTPETTIANNYAIVTGYVQQSQEISITIDAQNLTHTSYDRNGAPTRAVSGDLVQFTIDYFNAGNTTLHDVVISFNIPYPVPGMPQHYSQAIWTLAFGSGWTLIFTGIVWPQGFADIIGTTSISHSESGIWPEATDQATIIEKPMYCGDGFMTHDETCDSLWPVGFLRPGQQCLPRNPDNLYLGCEAITTSIINTGCVSYAYQVGTNRITANYCVNLTLPITQASCDSVTITEQLQIDNENTQIDFVCLWLNANDNTFISMDCGNGQIFNEYGTSLVGSCTYTGSAGETTTYTGQCSVWQDANNPACTMPVSILGQDVVSCDNLIPLDGTVLIVDEDANDWELEFRCETTNGEEADRIEIDCDYDGNNFDSDETITHATQLETTCSFDRWFEETYTVACRVNEETTITNDCSQLIIVDSPSLWYCGDGEREGREQCDLAWDRNEKTDIDDIIAINPEEDAPSRYANNGYYCQNCAIKWGPEDAQYIPPACFNVNATPTASVQPDEIMPIWRNLEADNLIDTHDGEDCKIGMIDEDSITCNFSIYNGKNLQSEGDSLYDFHINRCAGIEERDSQDFYDYILDQKDEQYFSIDRYNGGAITSQIGLAVNDFLDEQHGNPAFGEYKLTLESVEYDYCTSDEELEQWVIINRVCEVNFAVTKPYLMQKSAYGATNFTVSSAEINLRDFYDINGNELVSRTDLYDVMSAEGYDYDGGAEISDMIDNFINKYENIAIKLETSNNDNNIDQIKKVPGKDIYIFEWNGELTLSQKNWLFPQTPYTVIVKGMDLIIKGSVITNGMFIVPDGTINFQEDEDTFCETPQVVNGIFITDKGFDGNDINNYSEKNPFCRYGSLVVKGVMIGDDLDQLVLNRRSNLNTRFSLSSLNEKKIKEERRDKIFEGASVLIEYNPELRTSLPPGADEFTKALEVYKQ